MFNKLVNTLVCKLGKMFFEVGFCRLIAVTNRHSGVLVIVSTWICFKNVSASFID